MADQNFRNNELQAANPMAYLGVVATVPPNYWKVPRAPQTTDIQGYMIGDFWLDTSSLHQDPPVLPTTSNIWNLVAKDGGIATWVNFAGGTMSGILQIQGDTGGPVNPNSSGIFFFTGGTTGLTFAGASNTETLGGTLVIANGGTNASSMTNSNGVIYYDGTRLVTTTVGTATQVLTSNGPGLAPTFQPGGGGGGSITIMGDSGATLTGTSFTFTGGTTGLTFVGSTGPNTATVEGLLNVVNGGTGRASLTNHGLLVGAGTGPITQLGVGSSNSVLIGNSSNDPSFSSTPSVNSITILNAPSASTDGTNKAYVDAIASGISFVTAVVAATTPSSALSATYNNGTAGVGATLTNSGTQVAFAIDGITLTSSQRVLIKDFTGADNPWNGVYSVTTVGTGSTNWVLTRTTDYDTTSQIHPGTLIPVASGTINGGSSWIETATVSTIGTDPILFAEFSFGPSTFLQVANNLSDVANVVTSRSNLGLTNVAIQTVTNHDVLVGGTSNAITSVTPSTAGFVLTSNGTSADPSFQANTASPMTWTVVGGSTQAVVKNNGYFADNAGTVTFTLPASPALGDTYQVAQMATGQTFVINYASGQQIFIGTASTTIGTGNLTSTTNGDWVELVCRQDSPAQWQANVKAGNITPN